MGAGGGVLGCSTVQSLYSSLQHLLPVRLGNWCGDILDLKRISTEVTEVVTIFNK